MFGSTFFKHTAFLFTNWSYARKDINNRKRNNDSEAEKYNQFNKFLREAGIYNSHLLCFFIDNSLNDNQTFEESTEEEKK
jgi:hypothetical protein